MCCSVNDKQMSVLLVLLSHKGSSLRLSLLTWMTRKINIHLRHSPPLLEEKPCRRRSSLSDVNRHACVYREIHSSSFDIEHISSFINANHRETSSQLSAPSALRVHDGLDRRIIDHYCLPSIPRGLTFLCSSLLAHRQMRQSVIEKNKYQT